jgi:hypothetical protein
MGLFRDCCANQQLAAVADCDLTAIAVQSRERLAAIADQCLEASCLRLQSSALIRRDEGASSACAEAAVAQRKLKPKEEPQLN